MRTEPKHRRGRALAASAALLVVGLALVPAPQPAVAVPISAAPGCYDAPGDPLVGDFCPGDGEPGTVRLEVTGDIGSGAQVVVDTDVAPCDTIDGSGTFTPSRCYSGVSISVPTAPVCGYLDSYDRGVDRGATFYGRTAIDCSITPNYLTDTGSMLYRDWANTDYRTGLSRDSCEDQFTVAYVYGGPANVVGARWSERGPGALSCTFTRNATGPDGSDAQPDGLYGPTWIKGVAFLTIQNAGGESEILGAVVWLPVDGTERDRAPLAEFAPQKSEGAGDYWFQNTSRSQWGHPMGYEWTFEVVDPGDEDYRVLGTSTEPEPDFVFTEGTYARVTLVVTDLVNGLTDDAAKPVTIDYGVTGGPVGGGLPVVTVEATDATAAEAGPDPGAWALERSRVVDPMTVTVATSGSAIAGVDFVAVPQQITFPIGERNVEVALTPVADAVAEPAERVTLQVLPGAGYAVGDPWRDDVVITDAVATTTTTTTTPPPTSVPTTVVPPTSTSTTSTSTTTTTVPATTTTSVPATTTIPATTTVPATTTTTGPATTVPPTTTSTTSGSTTVETVVPSTTTTTTPPAVGSDRALVARWFSATTGRAPTTAESDRWAAALADAGSGPERIAAVAAAFVASPEYRTATVERAYRSDLGRASDADGRTYWTTRLESATTAALRASLLSSAEAGRAWPDDEEFVAHLYRVVLGRQPDGAGFAHWTARLASGTSRSAVARAFLSSTEAARFEVVEAYRQVLGREPTDAELDRWIPVVIEEGSAPLLVALLSASR